MRGCLRHRREVKHKRVVEAQVGNQEGEVVAVILSRASSTHLVPSLGPVLVSTSVSVSASVSVSMSVHGSVIIRMLEQQKQP